MMYHPDVLELISNPDVVASLLARLHEVDQDLHHMHLDASCPKRTPQQEPGVGPTWMPWCDGGHNANAGAG